VADKVFTILDVTIDGLPHRRYPNVSLGIEPHLKSENTVLGHHCNIQNNTKKDNELLIEMGYTPNRRKQAETLVDADQSLIQMAGIYFVRSCFHIFTVVGSNSRRWWSQW